MFHCKGTDTGHILAHQKLRYNSSQALSQGLIPPTQSPECVTQKDMQTSHQWALHKAMTRGTNLGSSLLLAHAGPGPQSITPIAQHQAPYTL